MTLWERVAMVKRGTSPSCRRDVKRNVLSEANSGIFVLVKRAQPARLAAVTVRIVVGLGRRGRVETAIAVPHPALLPERAHRGSVLRRRTRVTASDAGRRCERDAFASCTRCVLPCISIIAS
jgi:hypothetical protein